MRGSTSWLLVAASSRESTIVFSTVARLNASSPSTNGRSICKKVVGAFLAWRFVNLPFRLIGKRFHLIREIRWLYVCWDILPF